jgi:hypothetical protein
MAKAKTKAKSKTVAKRKPAKKPVLHALSIERDVVMPMADGVTLRADIYSPKAEGRFPVLLIRLPYDKQLAESASLLPPDWYARHGFIVVVQDTRGRFTSEGTFRPYHHERADGVETIRQCARLPNSNGKVGMFGFSYCGTTQLQPALDRPEGLSAIMPSFTNDGFYEDWTYKGGALHLAFLEQWSSFLALNELGRQGALEELRPQIKRLNGICSEYDHLPLTDHPALPRRFTPYFYEWLEHPTFDAYWKQWHLGGRYGEIDVPALHLGGWYDIFLEGTMRNFAGMREGARSQRARDAQKLVIGPWYHMPWAPAIGQLDFGAAGADLTGELMVRWYEHWLKGIDNGIMDEPRISLFVMGINRWRHADEWPIKGTRFTPYYLHSGGRANSLSGNGALSSAKPGEEPEDIYICDPGNPVQSLGGRSCCVAALTPMGPVDQRPAEIRTDVLVYSTPPLDQPVEVIGPIEAILHVSSTGTDTDFCVKLVDVYPDGRAINLVDGILRASVRDGPERPSAIKPSEVYTLRIRVGHTANRFLKGHRIRIEIASANFPTFERNFNQFHVAKNGDYTAMRNATNRVFHDAGRPSQVILPIVPARG